MDARLDRPRRRHDERGFGGSDQRNGYRADLRGFADARAVDARVIVPARRGQAFDRGDAGVRGTTRRIGGMRLRHDGRGSRLGTRRIALTERQRNARDGDGQTKRDRDTDPRHDRTIASGLLAFA